MLTDIESAYSALRLAVVSFNQIWPELVTRGMVWRLPLLAEQRTPAVIPVEMVDGHRAIELGREAFLQFERDIGQAAGTVMRLPGVFFVRQSVLDQVMQINALKDQLKDTIEQTRIELNVMPALRPRIMRRALGNTFNSNQLMRHIQAFDGAPRLIVFTWAGHTSGSEYKAVGQVREQLQALAEARADREGISIELTPEHQELKALVRMSDDESLVKRKLVAPHPRAMLYLGESTRYDAMIHANLPVFVLAGEGECEVRGLKDFNRDNRTAERPDRKSHIEALPGKDLYMPSSKKRPPSRKVTLEVDSTYGQKLFGDV